MGRSQKQLRPCRLWQWRHWAYSWCSHHLQYRPKKGDRNGRFFLVSTSTSTLSTTTVCYVTSATATCGRKKRSIAEPVDDYDPDLISPVAHKDADEDDDELVDYGMKDVTNRDARFLLYWATSTSTTTSYTSPSTLATLECVPSSWTLSACG